MIWRQNQGESSWGRHFFLTRFANVKMWWKKMVDIFQTYHLHLTVCLCVPPRKSMSLGFNGNLKIKQVNWHHSDCITYSPAKPVCSRSFPLSNPLIRRELGENTWLKFQFPCFAGCHCFYCCCCCRRRRRRRLCVVICLNDFPGNLMYFRLNNGTKTK